MAAASSLPPRKQLAGDLNVPLEDLKQYDNREPIADLKRLMDIPFALLVGFVASLTPDAVFSAPRP